jgi:hypothetical protein
MLTTEMKIVPNIVVICTGYTSRLVGTKKFREMVWESWDGEGDGEEDTPKPIYIKDALWGKDNTREYSYSSGDNAEVAKRYVEDKGLDGVICFENCDVSHLFCVVEKLGELDYCACLDPSNIYEMSIDTFMGQQILKIDIDCESG